METRREPETPYIVPAVAHAARILMLLKDGPHTGASLSEIARALGIPRSTCLNILRTLVAFGILAVDSSTKRYRLGWTLFELGQRAADNQSHLELLRPHLAALAKDLGVTCVLGRLVQDRLLIVDKVEGSGELWATTTVGQSHPLTAGAVGRAILAFWSEERLREYLREHGLPRFTPYSITEETQLDHSLAEVRRLGYAVSLEEYYLGINAIAAPVFEHPGEASMVVAALGLASVLSRDRIPEAAASVRTAAQRMTAALGGTWPSKDPGQRA